MAVNVPEVVVIDDNDHQTVLKIVGFFNAATSSNTKIQANTFKGANTSITPCLVGVVNILYSTSFSNGSIALEYVSTVNTNTRIAQVGRCNDGELNKYVPNNANTPSGDMNINIANAGANDSFTMYVTCLKEMQGAYWAFNAGAGAWANTQVGY